MAPHVLPKAEPGPLPAVFTLSHRVSTASAAEAFQRIARDLHVKGHH